MAEYVNDGIAHSPIPHRWLQPRLSEFRSQYWMTIYSQIEATERRRLSPGRKLEMLFFADLPVLNISSTGYAPVLTILALQNTLVRVLAGTVAVSSSKGISLPVGSCMLARGTIQLRAFDSNVSKDTQRCPLFKENSTFECADRQWEAALWSIRNIDQQVVVEPNQRLNYDRKLIIKKIFSCID